MFLGGDPGDAEIAGDGPIIEADAAGLVYCEGIGLDLGVAVHVGPAPVVEIASLAVLPHMAKFVEDVEVEDLRGGLTQVVEADRDRAVLVVHVDLVTMVRNGRLSSRENGFGLACRGKDPAHCVAADEVGKDLRQRVAARFEVPLDVKWENDGNGLLVSLAGREGASDPDVTVQEKL